MFRTAKNYLLAIKGLLALFACGYGLWKGVTLEITARRERAPTVIDVESFRQQYDGQQWLSLKGHFDADRAVLRPMGRSVGGEGGEAQVDLWVPLVGEHDEPDDPIHVFVSFGKMARSAAVWKLERLKSQPSMVTGMQVFYDAGKLFPGTPRAVPFVMIQPGSDPGEPGVGLALAAFFGLVLLVALWYLLRPLASRRGKHELPDGRR